MSIITNHKGAKFGIGDKVGVYLHIKEGDKERTQIFEGMVIAIKNREGNRTFTVRKIGAHNIGIERIFQLTSPFLEKIEVIKKGTMGVRRAKLYYTRKQSQRQIEEIYSRAAKKYKVSTKKIVTKKKVHAAKKS